MTFSPVQLLLHHRQAPQGPRKAPGKYGGQLFCRESCITYIFVATARLYMYVTLLFPQASTNSSTSGHDTQQDIGGRSRAGVQARAMPSSSSSSIPSRQAGGINRRRSQRTSTLCTREPTTKPIHKSLGITSPTEDKQIKDKLMQSQGPPPPTGPSLQVRCPHHLLAQAALSPLVPVDLVCFRIACMERVVHSYMSSLFYVFIRDWL